MERVQDYYARRALEQIRRDQPRLRKEFWDRKREDAQASTQAIKPTLFIVGD